MLSSQHCSRIDTMALKIQIERKLGQPKSQKYFNLLSSYLSLKLSKSEFSKLCIILVGRETICLHNEFLRAIIKNASLSKTPPPKQTKIANGYRKSILQLLCRDGFPLSPRKGRTPNLRDRKFKDQPSPLGPHGKIHEAHEGEEDQQDVWASCEKQNIAELLSLGSRPIKSVGESEEVEQSAGSPGTYSRSPVKAPLGIPVINREIRRVLRKWSVSSFHTQTCHNSCELPDMSSLKNRLEQKLEMEGLKTSMDCVSVLNKGLDVFLKRLIGPCLDLSGSRSQQKNLNQIQFDATSGLNGLRPMRNIQNTIGSFSSSVLHFRVAMELNPRILGQDWPVLLEKVCLCAYDEAPNSSQTDVLL